MKTPIPQLFILLLTVWFASLQNAHAVSPPPDGCYPQYTTAEGCDALHSLTTGAGNTAIGWRSLFFNTDASFNTAIGAGALILNNGDSNTATGAAALLSNTTGTANAAFGVGALAKNMTGSNNIAVGVDALFNQSTNNNNIGIGSSALYFSTTGGGNIAIGEEAGLLVNTAGDTICIGATGADVSGTCFIGSIRGVTTINNNAVPVVIDSSGQLGTVSCSRRYKKDIKSIGEASEAVLALKPVTFHYKSDRTNRPEYGLIAEDVAQINPNLVVRDKNGEIYTVRYDAVNAMLLNEFLKEHKTVEQQGQTIARLEKQLEGVTATLQKVSAQLATASPSSGGLEASNAVPQTVLNNQ